MADPNPYIPIGEFYKRAYALRKAAESGQLDVGTLSEAGRVAMMIANGQLSVNDLTNEGRMGVGLEPLPEAPGVAQRILTKVSDLAEQPMEALSEWGRRSVQGMSQAIMAPLQVPQNVMEAGQSFRQAGSQLMQGNLGAAASEAGGGIAQTGEALLNLGAPLAAPFVPAGKAAGMAVEGIPGGMTPIQIGAAKITPAEAAEFVGMGLAGAPGATRAPRATQFPAIGRPINYPDLIVQNLRQSVRDAAAALRETKMPEERAYLKETIRLNSEAAKGVKSGTIASFDELESFLGTERQTPPLERVYQAPETPGAAEPPTALRGPKAAPMERFGGPSPEVVPDVLREPFSQRGLGWADEPGLTPVAELTGLERQRMIADAQRGEPLDDATQPYMTEFSAKDLEQRYNDITSREAQDAAWRNKSAEMLEAEKAAAQYPGTEPRTIEEPLKTSVPGGKSRRTPGGKEKKVRAKPAIDLSTIPDNILRDIINKKIRSKAQEVAAEQIVAKSEPPAATAAELVSTPAPTPPAAAGESPPRISLTTEESKVIDQLKERGWPHEMALKVMEQVQKNPELANVVTNWLRPHEESVTVGGQKVTRQRLVRYEDVIDEVQSTAWGNAIKTGEELYGPRPDSAIMREAAERAGSEPGNYGMSITRPTQILKAGEAPTVERPGAKAGGIGGEVVDRKLIEDTAAMKGLRTDIKLSVGPDKRVGTEVTVFDGEGNPLRKFTSYKDAYDFVSREGPGAAGAMDELFVPQEVADTLIDPRRLSKFHASLMPARYGKKLGMLTGRWKVSTIADAMRRDAAMHELNSVMIEKQNFARRMSVRFLNRAIDIVKPTGALRNTQLADDLISYIQIMHDGDPAKIREAQQNIRPDIQRAAKRLQDEVFHPLADIIQQHRPDFVPKEWYFPHFVGERMLADTMHQLAHLRELKKQFPNRTDFDAEIGRLEGLEKSLAQQDQTLRAQRLRLIPGQGYFGPISESRTLNLPYERNLRGVLERYMEGFERTVFLDNMLPIAKDYLRSPSLAEHPMMADFGFDMLNVIRGSYGRKFTLALENMIENLGVKDPLKRQALAGQINTGVNIFNTLQVLRAMGGRIKSLIAQGTQPFMTLAPEIGYKLWLKHQFLAPFSKRAWRLARAVGETEFVPQSMAEMSSILDHIAQRGSWLDRVEFVAEGGTRVSMYGFQLWEKVNRVIGVSGGADYARTVLGETNPMAAARYGAAMSRRVNYMYNKVDRPILFASPEGRAAALFQTFKINFATQWLTNFQKGTAGQGWGPFLRQTANVMMLGGVRALPLYAALKYAAQQAGIDITIPAFERPVEWASHQAGLSQGGWQLEDMFSPFGPTYGPGGLAPISLVTQLATQGLYAALPLQARETMEGYTELKESQAGRAHRSFSTGKVVSRRSPGAAGWRMIGMTSSPESLQHRYLGEIESAVGDQNWGRVRILVDQAREHGINIPFGVITQMRERAKTDQTMKSRIGRFIEATGIAGGRP